jgi:hypothetical protein
MKWGIQEAFFRASAIGILAAWLGAQCLCVAHCAQGENNEGEHACCESSAAGAHTDIHHEEEESSLPAHAPCCENSCLMLKSALLNHAVVPTVFCGTHVSYCLPPHASFFTGYMKPATSLQMRQIKRVFQTFTPAVCLEPEFRSLAPPQV